MPILDQLQKDLVAAMKAKEEARLSALRMIKTALQKAHADTGKALDDAAEQQILKSLVKQRIDAADMFRKGGGRSWRSRKRRRKKKSSRVICRPPRARKRCRPRFDAALAETGATSATNNDGAGR